MECSFFAARWQRFIFRLILPGIAIFVVGRVLRYVVPRPHPEVERLREAADKGEVELQYKLGTMYAEGVEVPEDLAEAAKWYRMAAERGDVEAQLKLAVIYAFGRGVALDYSEAAKWYLQAAEQADDLTNRFDAASEAARSLGRLYETGRGVRQDYSRAIEWYRFAIELAMTLTRHFALATLHWVTVTVHLISALSSQFTA